jgi:hypothetical protein
MILEYDIELIDFLLTHPSELDNRGYLALEALKNHNSCDKEKASPETPTLPAAAVSFADEVVDYEWRAEDDAPLAVPSIVSASAPSSQLDQALKAPRSKNGATSHSKAQGSVEEDGAASDNGANAGGETVTSTDYDGFVQVLRKKGFRKSQKAGAPRTLVAERS